MSPEQIPPNPIVWPPPTRLSPQEEKFFQAAYASIARRQGLDPNPDSVQHYYDYRGAYKAGMMRPNGEGHFDSRFKLPGHPRYYMGPNGVFSPFPIPGFINTVTGARVPGSGYERRP